MVSEPNEVVLWFKIFCEIIKEGPLKLKILLICSVLVFTSTLNLLLIFPIIFNKFIIPNIEKKKRKKIIYPIFLNYIVFGMTMYRYILVARSISQAYLLYIFKGASNLKQKMDGVLAPLQYKISDASKFDVVMSCLVFLNQYTAVLSLATIIVTSKVS